MPKYQPLPQAGGGGGGTVCFESGGPAKEETETRELAIVRAE